MFKTRAFRVNDISGLAMALMIGAVAQYLNGVTFTLNEAMLDGHAMETPVLIDQRTAVEAYHQIISVQA